MKHVSILLILSVIIQAQEPAGSASVSELNGRVAIQFPGPPAVQRVDGEMDLSDVSEISFDAVFRGKASSCLWISLFFLTDGHLQYQSCSGVNILPGVKKKISVKTDPRYAGLEPCGHCKPWTAYEAEHIRAAGIKIHADGYAAGHVFIWNIEKQTQQREEKLSLYDLQQTCTGRILEISFRTTPSLKDLFNRDITAVQGILSDKNGRTLQIRNAFAYQHFIFRGKDPALLRKHGPIQWKIRFSPGRAGDYTCKLNIIRKNMTLRSAGPFSVGYEPSSSLPGESRQISEPEEPYTVEAPRTNFNVSVLTSKGWRLTDKKDGIKRLWYPVIQWNEDWGFFRGLNRFNQQRMFLFDRHLDSAGKEGYIVLQHENGLCMKSMYHWKANPLNAANGGPISRVSEFFSNEAAFKNLKNRIAYAIARWGAHPSVRGFVIANTIPARGGWEWNRKLSNMLSKPCYSGVQVYSFHPQAVEPLTAESVDFSRAWSIHRDIASTGTIRTFGNRAVTVKGSFPGEIPLAGRLDCKWGDMDGISFDVRAPEEAPEHMRVLVYVRDQQWTWHEKLLECPVRPGDITSYFLSFSEHEQWRTPDGSPGWYPYTALRIRELGIRILGNCETDRQLEFTVSNITVFQKPKTGQKKGTCTNITLNRQRVEQYGKLEITFDISRKYKNPFDPECVRVDGIFTSPDGTTSTVPAFFYQPFERRMKKGRETLTQSGMSKWKIRFSPAAPGSYSFRIEVRDTSETFSSDTASFTCIPGMSKGFIRTSDSGYFRFDNGDFFYPIGMNIRSPADSRQPYSYPFTQYKGMGTYAYDIYFRKMEQNRMNWCRIWLCSWWCGLEWRDDWASYGGIGYFNMKNAWRFDHILSSAEERGIFLQVDTMNHGQLSIKIDREWQHNPYNRTLGGFLSKPEDYFTDTRARKLHRNKLRYIVARWGYSTHILSWMLLTEVEFTGEYFRTGYKNGDRPGSYPKTTAWHREMARYLKEVDCWDHPVGTHFSHPQRGSDIWRIPEIDITESNVYTAFLNFPEFRLGRHGSGIAEAVDNYYHRIFRKYRKPVLIGEYGGHWSKNSANLLDSELHCGIWASIMTPLAGNTGYWWWPHVHFRDLYGEYLSAALFMQGEDLSRLKLRRTSLRVSSKTGYVKALALKNRSGTVWAWIYDARIITRHIKVQGGRPLEKYTRYFKNGITVEGAFLKIPPSVPGTYTLEFWNTYTGEITASRKVNIGSGKNIQIKLPPFKNDTAVKIYQYREQDRKKHSRAPASR